MDKIKLRKPNTIYIDFDYKTGFFNVMGYSTVGKTTVGVSTDKIQGVVECIRAVSNSLNLLLIYKDKAIPFVTNEMDFSTFVHSIGGREKFKDYSIGLFPVIYY